MKVKIVAAVDEVGRALAMRVLPNPCWGPDMERLVANMVKQVRKRHAEYAHIRARDVRERLDFHVYVLDEEKHRRWPEFIGTAEDWML